MKKKEIFIIIGILFAAVVAFLVVEATKQEGTAVEVKVNGVYQNTYSLFEDGTYSLNGGTNILVVKNRKAYLIEANCPDKLCVKQFAINKVGETITCLPNKLTITVLGNASTDSPELFS